MKYDIGIVLDYYKEAGLNLLAEYQFTLDRDFRFDFFHEPSGVALEVMGGVWMARGGHTTGAGYVKDMEKENLALSLGYRVMKCLPQDVCMDDTREMFLKIVEVANGKSKHRADPEGNNIACRRCAADDVKEPKAGSRTRRPGARTVRSAGPEKAGH